MGSCILVRLAADTAVGTSSSCFSAKQISYEKEKYPSISDALTKIAHGHLVHSLQLVQMGCYSSTTMCQYWDNRLIY